jgi:ankyrin repeat protein
MTRWGSALLWLPLLAAVLIRVVLLSSSIAGHPVLWGGEPMTLSEAAAFRDAGEVARLLSMGLDPNADYHVRRGAVKGRIEATPLEAARASGREDMVRLLLDNGATR